MPLPATLGAGQVVRSAEISSVQSDWSAPLTALDHVKEFPAGPLRPAIRPTPVYKCGIRIGVGNLLSGGNLWITAAGKVGRVDALLFVGAAEIGPLKKDALQLGAPIAFVQV